MTSRWPLISKICPIRDLRNITSGKCPVARVIHQPNSKYHSADQRMLTVNYILVIFERARYKHDNKIMYKVPISLHYRA